MFNPRRLVTTYEWYNNLKAIVLKRLEDNIDDPIHSNYTITINLEDLQDILNWVYEVEGYVLNGYKWNEQFKANPKSEVD